MEILRVLEQLPVETKLVRFFERDGYEVYGDDAVLVAGLLFRQSALGSIEDTLFLTLSPGQFVLAVKELIKEHRIEIWEFNATRRSWKVNIRASPGNCQQLESIFPEETEIPSAIIASVFIRGDRVGLATIDTTRFTIGWALFVDSELLANLESALTQLDAKECILPQGVDTGSLFENSSFIGTPIKSSEFEANSAMNDLSRLCSLDTGSVSTEEIPFESQAAISGLIKYLGLFSSDDNLGVFTLQSLKLTQYMRLDETALKTLNIFPGATGGKESSLFGILDHSKTRQGSRLLAQWIRQPLLNLDEINQRFDIVETLVNESIQRQVLRDTVLRGIPDIGRVGRKLVKGKASLQVYLMEIFTV